MKNNIEKRLLGPFTKIARAQSGKHDVNIISSGTKVCTDGEDIYIPFNADYLGEGDVQILHGMLDHEICHVAEERRHAEAGRTTPMDLMRRCKGKVESMLLNVFEDVRCETSASKRQVGVAENLNAVNMHSVDMFRKRHGDASAPRSNFWHTLGCGIIMKARGYDTGWMHPAYGPFMELVSEEIEESTTEKCDWADDSMALARRVIKKVAEAADAIREEEKRREKERGEGDESEGWGFAEGTGEESADGEDAGEESSEGDDATGDSIAAKGSLTGIESLSDEEMAAMIELAERTKEECDVSDILDATKEDISSKSSKDVEKHRRYMPHPGALAADEVILPRGYTQGQFASERDRVREQIHGMRSKLVTIIRTQAQEQMSCDLEEGELDTEVLASVRMGNKRIFSDVTPGRKIDTAISILVDMSGSMGGAKEQAARLTAIALAETFHSLKVSFEIMGWSNEGSMLHRSGGRGRYTRFEPFKYFQFKGFDENLPACRLRFGEMEARGNNADGEAVMFAARRLARRPEGRKMLFVLSDGMPCAHGSDFDKHLTDTVKTITKAGISVIGFGIQTDAVRKFYNHSTGARNIVIDNISELSREVYGVMRQELLGRDRRAA